MKKKTITILLLLTVLLVGGGFVVWKLSSNKEKVSSSSSQQKKNLPLNELSDQELEKRLLEDFSRRLELEKYFVFNLGELKTMKEKPWKNEWGGNTVNKRHCSEKLIDHLSQINAIFRKMAEKKGHKMYGRSGRKEGITFVKTLGQAPDDDSEWTGGKLDQKIEEKSRYVVFAKYDDDLETFFNPELDENGKTTWYWKNWIVLKTESPYFHVFENKESALKFLKTDPALSDESL